MISKTPNKVTRNSKNTTIKGALRAARPSLTPFLIVFLLLPNVSLAAGLQITEIMYDPPRANTGHQWIEVTNTSDAAVNLSGYKVYETGTNHAVTFVSGSKELTAGGSAILATNPAIFSSDYPDYSGSIFKSSITLPKAGVLMALKDATLQVVDSVSYDENAGAAGNGNSLHRSGKKLIIGAPNPGSTTTTSPAVTSPKTAQVTTKAAASSVPVTAIASSTPVAVAAPSKNQGPHPASTYNPNASQLDAPLLSQINLPAGPLAYALGGVGVILIGVSAMWYLGLQTIRQKRNILSADEFEIE